ncbi:MAG: hypothetical protein NZ936_10590 [Alphaproteobacteria bacterium]|nr:hypothetical protein [Alphaproteobacteria bacterium]
MARLPCRHAVCLDGHRTGSSTNVQTDRRGCTVIINMTSEFPAPVRQEQWMGPYVNVIKETRSLIFAYGLLNADGELPQRTNAVMKASRGLND